MAHLLMIESWVGASGNLLPPLIKSMGHTYTFVTRKLEHYQNALSTEQHPVIRYADSVLVTETNDVPSLINFLSSYSFDGVITVCDYYIETVREVAHAFHLPCPFPSSVKNVRQKHLMRRLLDQAELEEANPNYRLAQDWNEVEQASAEIGFPLVIKPVDLASSAYVRLIRNSSELQEAYCALAAFPLNFREQERDRTYLLEEYMTGEEFSVESISYQGETTIIGVTDKSVTGTPYFIENGHMFPAQLADDVSTSIIHLVREALEAVGYDHGIAHTEVKLTKSGPRIVEINPRTAGNYIVELIQRVTGVDMLEAFVDLAIGKQHELSLSSTAKSSAAVMFLVPPQGGKIRELDDAESLLQNRHIVRYKLENCVGKEINEPIDNACYLGHLIAQDPDGLRARAYAEEALKKIKLRFHPKEAKV